MLFITIACGACSGFHSLIASGTTSKQLTTESSARAIGYGTMLLEAMVAIVSLCCVMMIPAGSPMSKASPNFVYASGIGTFLSEFGLSRAVGVSFALMAFNTFVFDTLDVCTRLGRFILQELTGWKSAAGRWFGTLLTAGERPADSIVACVLGTLWRQQSVAGRTDTAGNHRLAVADAAAGLGPVRGGTAGGVHVHDEFMGADFHRPDPHRLARRLGYGGLHLGGAACACRPDAA
jgi:carbon starvation protein CstA